MVEVVRETTEEGPRAHIPPGKGLQTAGDRRDYCAVIIRAEEEVHGREPLGNHQGTIREHLGPILCRLEHRCVL